MLTLSTSTTEAANLGARYGWTGAFLLVITFFYFIILAWAMEEDFFEAMFNDTFLQRASMVLCFFVGAALAAAGIISIFLGIWAA